MIRLEELKEAFAASTPGEWWYSGNRTDDRFSVSAILVGNAVVCDTRFSNKENNATFIAQAHNLMPHLLAAVEMVNYAVDVFEGACDCGECGPCRTAVKMRALLENLK